METILFIIIAGILSTIFGKAKGKGQPKRPKSMKAKDFSDFRALFEQPSKKIPEKEGQITTGQPVMHEKSSTKIEEKFQQIKNDNDVNPVGRIYSNAEKKLENEQVFTEEPDKKTIINGIIWAEILGPPRAKRPFSDKR